MATTQPNDYRPLSDAQLRAGTPMYGKLTDEALAMLEGLKRTYSWRDRFLRPGFVIDEVDELLEDLCIRDDQGNQRINYTRLEARQIQFDNDTMPAIKVWATREISDRRRWISTLKLWRWVITLAAPVPAIAFANFLSRWAINTFLNGI